ncbi:MAG: metallophosphoesterase family protein, partial [Candidatus Thorarchaeota archaeon]
YKIAVIGDTQGFTTFYEGLIQNASMFNYAFILHLGDMTSFGTQTQFESFNKITRQSKIPVFFTPGNHDVKQENSSEQYKRNFGKTDYFFIYGGILFISLDSSRGFFTENSFIILETLLIQYQALPKIIYSHIPIFDPREGNDHSLLNKSQPKRFFNLIQNQNVKAVLSGHIHYFNYTEINGTFFITSGGGGAALHEPKENGGFHHFTEIEISNLGQSILFKPIKLTRNLDVNDIVVIQGSSSNVISLSDLQIEFQTILGNSSFQNQYGNWRAYGEYMGVRVSDLLLTVGGITPNQILEIEAWDGLSQNYSYSVIFPNSTWQEIQGEMILAYSYNGTFFPNWIDGYRIVFLPPDQAYSNADCEATSTTGEGYHIWPSAGFRWIKFVKLLRILYITQ